MKIEHSYDFSDVVEQIKPLMLLDRFKDDTQQPPFALAKALLGMPEFPEFAASFFQDRAIWNDIKAMRVIMSDDNRLPDHQNPTKLEIHGFFLDAEPSESRFFKQPNRAGETLEKIFQTVRIPHKPVRNESAYPLTAEETGLSTDFLRQHDDLMLAIIGVKYCILTYYNTLDEAIQSGIIKNNELADQLDKERVNDYHSYIRQLKDNTEGTSSTEELAPILANVLRNAENSRDQHSLQKAFRHLFERSAFANYNSNRTNVYNQCPFSNALIRAMQLDLQRITDDLVTPMGQSYAGALINFARSEIAAYHDQLAPDMGADDEHLSLE